MGGALGQGLVFSPQNPHLQVFLNFSYEYYFFFHSGPYRNVLLNDHKHDRDSQYYKLPSKARIQWENIKTQNIPFVEETPNIKTKRQYYGHISATESGYMWPVITVTNRLKYMSFPSARLFTFSIFTIFEITHILSNVDDAESCKLYAL